MAEFYVFKEKGISGIIDAVDLDDARAIAGANVLSIEETEPESIKHHKVYDDKELDYYSQYFEEENPLVKKINKLIEFFNSSNKVNIWDKTFIFGVKKSLKNNSKLSTKQTSKINQILVKYAV